MRCHRCGREIHGDDRATPGGVRDFNRASRAVTDCLADGKPQARASTFPAPRRVTPIKRFKDMGAIFVRDAISMVPHDETNCSLVDGRRRLDRRCFRTMLQSIQQDV